MKALLLEGGGAKGAFQAGAIKALCKKGIYFDAAGGTSIGAINAAFYVTHNLNGLYKLWLSTESDELLGIESKILDDFSNRKITKNDIKIGLFTVGRIIKNRGIDTTNIKKVLDKNINEKRFRKSKIEYGMNTFSLSDFKPVYMFKKDIPIGKLTECILSSAYLPFFKLERIIDKKFYVDGGVYVNCPVDMFVDAGYNEIYVIKAWQKKLKFKNKKGAKVHIITPREDLGSIVRFTKEASNYRFNLGYYDMLKYLDNLDGNKYYFKKYSDDYYNNLFDDNSYLKIIKELNSGKIPSNNKEFIIDILEKACKSVNIERFKIYNLPFLITRLKYRFAAKTNNKYYYFIKKIKVEFE